MFTILMVQTIDITREQTSETVDSVLEAIQVSQLDQQRLYNQLRIVSDNDDSTDEQRDILKSINRLSTVRKTLFITLDQIYRQLGSQLGTARGVLADQITVAKVMEQQLSEANRSLDQVVGSQDNKMRMVEINTYYADKYKAQTGLMQLIIVVSVVFLVVVISMKRKWVPAKAGAIVLVGVSIVGILLIGVRVVDIGSRSNMVFDEYDWDGPPAYIATEKKGGGDQRPFVPCVNSLCCAPGTKFVNSFDPGTPSYCAADV